MIKRDKYLFNYTELSPWEKEFMVGLKFGVKHFWLPRYRKQYKFRFKMFIKRLFKI